jgi:hypothetical protein
MDREESPGDTEKSCAVAKRDQQRISAEDKSALIVYLFCR